MDIRWNQTDRNSRRLFKYNSTVCVVNTGGALVGLSCVQNHYTTKGDKEKSPLHRWRYVHVHSEWLWKKQNKVQQQEGNNSGSRFTNVDCWTLSLLLLFFKLYCNYAWLWVDVSPMCPGMQSVSLWIRDSRVWGDMGNRSLVFPEFVLQEKQTNKQKKVWVNKLIHYQKGLSNTLCQPS